MGTDCGDEHGGTKKQEDLLQDSDGTRQGFSRYRIYGRGRETQLLLGESQKVNPFDNYYGLHLFLFFYLNSCKGCFYAVTEFLF